MENSGRVGMFPKIPQTIMMVTLSRQLDAIQNQLKKSLKKVCLAEARV